MKNKVKLFFFNLLGETIFAKLQAGYWARRLKEKKFFYEKEIDLLSGFIYPGSVAIDIGANCGQYTHPLSKLVGPTGRVVSIEPLKYNFQILKNAVEKLRLKNVELKNIALSDKSGEAEIITPFDSSGLPLIAESYLDNGKGNGEGKREIVKTLTLDELKIELPILESVKFIKCDVEGAEMMVFKGGRTLLSECQPVIFCEIEERHIQRYGYTSKELFVFLNNLGYCAFIFVSGKLVSTQGIRESEINYIFINETFIKNNTSNTIIKRLLN